MIDYFLAVKHAQELADMIFQLLSQDNKHLATIDNFRSSAYFAIAQVGILTSKGKNMVLHVHEPHTIVSHIIKQFPCCVGGNSIHYQTLWQNIQYGSSLEIKTQLPLISQR